MLTIRAVRTFSDLHSCAVLAMPLELIDSMMLACLVCMLLIVMYRKS